MDRINGANWIDIGGGKHGFRNRNLSLGQAGTTVDAAWLNGIQEELLAFLLAANISPDGNNNAQVLASMRQIALAQFQAFQTSGSCVVPAGKTQALVLLWAGGGGGGGSFGAGSAGSAGGGGGFRMGLIPSLTPGGSIPVTIGAAGSGGNNSVSPYNGTAGGNSSFGASITCIGGGAGLGANGAIQSTPGAGGGGGSGGQLSIGGGTGGTGYLVGSSPLGGVGGNAFMTSITGPSAASAGLGGSFPAGGGGSGSLGNVGGAGAPGLCLVLFI